MQTLYCVTFFLLLLPTLQADPVSIEQFKKIGNPDDRMTIIERAPPEQQAELRRINLHIENLRIYGGEAGVTRAKENQAAKARGLGALEDLFSLEYTFRESYSSCVDTANEIAGMTKDEQVETATKLYVEDQVITKRRLAASSMIAHLAASPQAIELEARTQKVNGLIDSIQSKANANAGPSFHPITKEERTSVNQQVDQIYEQATKLPMLSPEQFKKEVDAVPEGDIYIKTTRVEGGSRIRLAAGACCPAHRAASSGLFQPV